MALHGLSYVSVRRPIPIEHETSVLLTFPEKPSGLTVEPDGPMEVVNVSEPQCGDPSGRANWENPFRVYVDLRTASEEGDSALSVKLFGTDVARYELSVAKASEMHVAMFNLQYEETNQLVVGETYIGVAEPVTASGEGLYFSGAREVRALMGETTIEPAPFYSALFIVTPLAEGELLLEVGALGVSTELSLEVLP